MLIAYRKGDRAIFLYRFAKNERDNIQDDELKTLKEIAAHWLKGVGQKDLKNAIEKGVIEEIKYAP